MALAARGEWGASPFPEQIDLAVEGATAGARGRNSGLVPARASGLRMASPWAAEPFPFPASPTIDSTASFPHSPPFRNTNVPGRTVGRVQVTCLDTRGLIADRAGRATIARRRAGASGTGAVGEGAGPGHQQVRVVEQLEVLDVSVDAAVEEHPGPRWLDRRLVGLLFEQPECRRPGCSFPPVGATLGGKDPRWRRSGTCRYRPVPSPALNPVRARPRHLGPPAPAGRRPVGQGPGAAEAG